MFNENVKRFGFACIIHEDIGKQKKDCKIGTVTVKSMKSLSESKQYDKLKNKVLNNLIALSNQIDFISSLPSNRRMFRIGSGLLPLYDHVDFKELYDKELLKNIKEKLHYIGNNAMKNDIRLSMHPSQFCVLNSDTQRVVKNSIVMLEMHADIARFMGFGKKFQDFKINIHLNGKTDSIPINELSDVSKKTLTLENDERTGNINRVLNVANKYDIAMVLDIHHHWCNSGIFIQPNDPLIKK